MKQQYTLSTNHDVFRIIKKLVLFQRNKCVQRNSKMRYYDRTANK